MFQPITIFAACALGESFAALITIVRAWHFDEGLINGQLINRILRLVHELDLQVLVVVGSEDRICQPAFNLDLEIHGIFDGQTIYHKLLGLGVDGRADEYIVDRHLRLSCINEDIDWQGHVQDRILRHLALSLKLDLHIRQSAKLIVR